MASFNVRRGLAGLLLGLGGHALAFLAAFISARVVEPSEGGGFEDIAAVALTFLTVEALHALASVIGGIILIVKGRRETGYGLLLGWFIGLMAYVIAIRA
ncbi:hypothetical protein [Catelliglobosispora koreensis]|uniref:hypothetical protein n=1 Tax=Catelliglobosispora koreensis TaxID=129052 RepID=UPI000381FD0D|nr:hypothetical protein [Catelliglobosispora koreensis]